MALTVGPQRTNPAARAALRHGSNTAKRTARSATAESWCTSGWFSGWFMGRSLDDGGFDEWLASNDTPMAERCQIQTAILAVGEQLTDAAPDGGGLL